LHFASAFAPFFKTCLFSLRVAALWLCLQCHRRGSTFPGRSFGGSAIM
jgi:hypothetical protein